MDDLLEITAFGGLQIRLGGRPLADLGSRKAEALLVFLACTRRPQPREVLADLLWDARATSQALMNLRWPLSRLHARMPAHLVITRTTVAFNAAAPYRLDVEELETALGGARNGLPREDPLAPDALRALAQATALYHGPFLQGFALRDSGGFDEWMLREQDRLQQVVSGALHEIAAAAEAGDDPALGLQAATRLVQLDPFDEAAHRQVMRLCARRGQRRAALEQYHACRRLLAAELGVTPAAETTALYEQIRAGGPEPGHSPGPGAAAAPAARRPRPERLPQPLTSFIPRPAELAALADLLADPSCRLITLVGPGGSGKTRLAIEAARVAPGGRDGVVFVPLAAVSDPRLLVSTLAAALEIGDGDAPALAARLHTWLVPREVLLVLDNFEQLAAGAIALVDLLAAAPGLRLLVTSREPLNLAAEQIFDVAGLPVPPADAAPGDPDPESYAAVQLFVARARRVRYRFALGPDVTPWVVAICRLVEGLPLAIELAAVAVRERSCRELAITLDQTLGELATTQADVPERQRSLRAVCDSSWALLSPAERTTLARVAVFRGGFDADAARAVASATRPVLARLVQRSLLRQGPDGHFGCHELVREYAERRLHELPAEPARSETAHARYFLALAEAAHPELVGPRQVGWQATLEREQPNLRVALTRALAPGHPLRAGDLALRLSTALNRFWYFRGALGEGRRWLEAALAATPAPEPGARAAEVRAATLLRGKALNALGSFAREQGDLAAALPALEASLPLVQTADEPVLAAAVLNNLGLATRDQGDYARAETLIAEALAHYQAAGDWQSAALLHNNLGKLAHHRRDLAAARDHLQASLALHAGLTDPRGRALTQANLAQVARDAGAPEEAARLFRAGLRLYLEVGDERGITDCLEGLFVVAAGGGAALDPAGGGELAVLYGAATALRARTGACLVPPERAALDRAVGMVRAALGAAAWEAALTAGQRLGADAGRAAAYALDLASGRSIQ